MGNAFGSLYKKFHESPVAAYYEPLGPHGVSQATVGVSALAQDLFYFDKNSQLPQGLSKLVASTKAAQTSWFKKLVDAWKEANPPPRTPEEVAELVIETLKTIRKEEVEGFLTFYGLPQCRTLDKITGKPSTSLPEGVQYELHTLPVPAKAVADGDSITAYVRTTEPSESSLVPRHVQEAAMQRSEARAGKDFTKADALHQQIIDSGYRVLNLNNEEILARKYRIRLRGVDAPEREMRYGKEAKDELTRIVEGKCLRVLVYEEDHYGRAVGDVYCDDIFAQELLLKKGCAWHFTAYDKRMELATWEKEAREKRVGLWASPNPEQPWAWRKRHPRSYRTKRGSARESASGMM